MERCPHCDTNLQGNPIPEESRHYYGNDKTHFSRKIGVEITGAYDGCLYWACPDCGGRWHRWPEGHYLHERAEPYVAKGEDPELRGKL